MRVRYDEESDVLILILRDEAPVDAVEEPGGVIVSYGDDGEPVSVEFLNATVRKLIRAGEVSVTVQTCPRAANSKHEARGTRDQPSACNVILGPYRYEDKLRGRSGPGDIEPA